MNKCIKCGTEKNVKWGLNNQSCKSCYMDYKRGITDREGKVKKGPPFKNVMDKKIRVNATISPINYNFVKENYINLSAVLNEKLSELREKYERI